MEGQKCRACEQDCSGGVVARARIHGFVSFPENLYGAAKGQCVFNPRRGKTV
jgi:hypothetical protein